MRAAIRAPAVGVGVRQPNGKRLEVRLQWGPVVLRVEQFACDRVITVGNQPGCDFCLPLPGFGPEPIELAGPGPAGEVVVQAGFEVIAQREPAGRAPEPVAPAGLGQVVRLGLRPGERIRLGFGQLDLTLRLVGSARPVHTRMFYRLDASVPKIWGMTVVLVIGMWMAIQATPPSQAGMVQDRIGPARYARLVEPPASSERRTFERIELRPEPRPTEPSDQRIRSAADRRRRPRTGFTRSRPEDDRRVAIDSGILRLLKERASGGSPSGSLVGGVQASSLEDPLEGLRPVGVGQAGFLAGVNMRGGPPGGQGPGLDLDGLGGWPHGRPDGPGFDSVKVPQRPRSGVRFDREKVRLVGGLTHQVVGEAIQRHYSRFKYCYERELGRAPNLYGKLVVHFAIDGTGRVEQADVLQSSLQDANVEACVLRTVRSIRFPAPRGGGEVLVSYPFLFHTAGQ